MMSEFLDIAYCILSNVMVPMPPYEDDLKHASPMPVTIGGQRVQSCKLSDPQTAQTQHRFCRWTSFPSLSNRFPLLMTTLRRLTAYVAQ